MSNQLTDAELIINFNTTPVKEFLKRQGDKVDNPEYIGPRKWNEKSKKYELIFPISEKKKDGVKLLYYKNYEIRHARELKAHLERLHELCTKKVKDTNYLYIKKYVDQYFVDKVNVKSIKYYPGDKLSTGEWRHEDVFNIDKVKGGKRKTRRGKRKSNRKSKKNTKRRTRKH